MPWKNVPLCDWCYQNRHPERSPFRLRETEVETCHDCGKETISGIYCRIEVKED